MELCWLLLLIAGHLLITAKAGLNKDKSANKFKSFKPIHMKPWPSKSFKPFKKLHSDPWPSLQHNTNKVNQQTSAQKNSKDKGSVRSIKKHSDKGKRLKNKTKRYKQHHRETSIKRGLLDALKGANISIENHVHSVTVDKNKQQGVRRGILDSLLKGANISIENHVHSVKVSKKQDILPQRRGILDALKGANISIENHVHSVKVSKKQNIQSHTVKSIMPSNGGRKRTFRKEDTMGNSRFQTKRPVDVTGSKRDETFGDGMRLEGNNPMDVAAEIESNDKNLIPILSKESPEDLVNDDGDDDHRGGDNEEDEEEPPPEYTVSDKDDFPAERDPYFNEKQKEVQHHEPPSQRDEHFRHREGERERERGDDHDERDQERRRQEHGRYHPPLHGAPDFEEHEFPVNSYMKGRPEDHDEQSNLYMGHRWPHGNEEDDLQRADGNHDHPPVSRQENYDEERRPHENSEEQHHHGGLGRDEYNRNRENMEGSHGDREHEERYNNDNHRYDGGREDYDRGRERDNRRYQDDYRGERGERGGDGERERHYHDQRDQQGSHQHYHGNTEDPQRYHDEILYGHLHEDMGFHGNEAESNRNSHDGGHGDGRDGGEVFGAIHGERCVMKKDGICMPEGEGGHHGEGGGHHETSVERMIEYQRNPFDPHDIDINHHHDEDEHQHEAVNSPIPQSVLQIGVDPSSHVHYMSRDEHHDLHYDNSLFEHHTPHHEGQYNDEGGEHHGGGGTLFHHNPHDDYEGEYSSHAVRISPHDNPHEYERHELDHPVHDHIHTASDRGNVDWDDHDGHYGSHGSWGHDGGHAEGGRHHEGGHHDDDDEGRLAYEHRHTYPAAPHQAPYVPIFTPPQRELPMFQVGHAHNSDHYHNSHVGGERRTNTLKTGQMFEFGNRDYASYLNQHLGDYLKQASYEYKVMSLAKKDFGIENVMAKKRKLENDAQAVLNETEILKQLQDNSSTITILDNEQKLNNETAGNNFQGNTNAANKQFPNINNNNNTTMSIAKQSTNQTANKLDKTIASFLNNADISSLLVESDKDTEAGVRRKNIPKTYDDDDENSVNNTEEAGTLR